MSVHPGTFWSAPDFSVSITAAEAVQAFEIFHHADWSVIDQQMLGKADNLGRPIDRHNPDVRRAMMAEAATVARGAVGGTGIDQMNNPHFRTLVDVLIESYDKHPKP